MGLDYCPECGKLYVQNAIGLCADCYRQEEEDVEKVAEYLREKTKASLEEIHQATGIRHKVILRMIKRGRIVTDTEITYECELCGAPIIEGRLCADCSKTITEQLKPKVEEWSKPEPRDLGKKDERLYIRDMFKR